MAYKLPIIPDEKLQFYRDKLRREVSNLFEWTGLPEEIPVDYLERALIEGGRVMFFYDDRSYGYMAFKAGIRGFNLYNQPTKAFATTPNDLGLPTHYERTIVHKYDENLGKENSCVLINNMYHGESLNKIIDHYSYRLALIQQAFDTNALWQNIPVIFSTDNQELKLSVEKLFAEIMEGKPWVLLDKSLLAKENGVQSDVLDIPFLLDKLYDAKNEVYNEFKMTIGVNAPAVEKKERVLVDEVNSNEQYLETCLQIMLSQRKIACEEIKKVFGLDVDVNIREIEDPRGGEVIGPGYHGIEAGIED